MGAHYVFRYIIEHKQISILPTGVGLLGPSSDNLWVKLEWEFAEGAYIRRGLLRWQAAHVCGICRIHLSWAYLVALSDTGSDSAPVRSRQSQIERR